MRMLLPAIAMAGFVAAGAQAQKYETKDGCDEGRWKEWESIIIGFEGYTEEQEDARSVRESNRTACAELKAGKITQEEATRRYDREVEAWVKRIEGRQLKRRGTSEAGAG